MLDRSNRLCLWLSRAELFTVVTTMFLTPVSAEQPWYDQSIPNRNPFYQCVGADLITVADFEQMLHACARYEKFQPVGHPLKLEYLRRQAFGHVTLMQHDQAVAMLDKILKITPLDKTALLYRARALLWLNRLDDSLLDLDRLILLYPTDPNVFLQRARAYQFYDRRENALADLASAVALNPRNPDDWLNMAILFRDLGDPLKAELSLDRAIALDGENPGLYEARADLRFRKENYAGALDDIANALRDGPNYSLSIVYSIRWQASAKLGRWKDALLQLSEYMDVYADGRDSKFLFERARLYQRLGQREDAMRDLVAALQTGDERQIRRIQVYLRNNGFARIPINGIFDLGMRSALKKCLLTPSCSNAVAQPL